MDIFTTTVELAGGQVPRERIIDGVNLMPYILGEKQGQPHDGGLFWRQRLTSVRRGDYKLVRHGKNAWLYDIQNDLSETTDLSAQRPELKETFLKLTDSIFGT